MVKVKTKRTRVRAAVLPKKKKNQLTLLGTALRTLGGLGGGSIGALVGQSATGSAVGTSLGATISKWLGSGDYTLSSNTITQRVARGSDAIPMMHSEGQSVTVRHREYVCEILSNTTFKNQRFFPIQPGDSNTFPWLSSIASRFQQYKFKGIVFHYVPTSGYAVSGTNPAIGSVMMQTSYRVNDAAPTSKQELLNEYWANESSPAEAFCHPIECAPKENPFAIHYTRTSPVPASDSPLLYDIGMLNVAVSGMPASDNVVGDLWVTYEVELSKPIVSSNVHDSVFNGFLSSVSPVPGNWFPSSGLISSGSLALTASTNTLAFPIGITGSFFVQVDLPAVTTFSAVDLSGSATLVNCSYTTRNAIGDAAYIRTVLTGTAPALGRASYTLAVLLTDPSKTATITFPAGTWTGTAAYAHVVAAEL